MTPGELDSYAKVMKTHGIKRITIDGIAIELSYGDSITDSTAPRVSSGDISPVEDISGSSGHQEPDPIKHKVEEMASLLKMDDADLINRLFPDSTEKEED